MNRICPECGQEFKINSHFQNRKKYCSERCSQAVIKRRKQKNNKTIKQPASKRKCYDCLYSAPKEDSNKCDYIYLTAEKRGCPSGAGCTRYKKSTPDERSEYRKKVMSKWDNTFKHKIE